MKVVEALKNAFRHEKPIHPIDARLAREWVKRRLRGVFPELRGNPGALDRAYRELNLVPCAGNGRDEPETVFEIRTADRL